MSLKSIGHGYADPPPHHPTPGTGGGGGGPIFEVSRTRRESFFHKVVADVV